MALLAEVAKLRASVAAVERPDEGMRGTAADERKMQAASDAAIRATLARALVEAAACTSADLGDELAATAAATVRSISITPQAAAVVAADVAAGCCAALRARRGLSWLLAAVARLAQHAECHEALLGVGAVQALAEAWRLSLGDAEQPAGPLSLGAFGSGRGSAVRLDLVACIVLSFLSESLPAAAALVPPAAVAAFVETLDRRLALPAGPAEAQHIVEQGLFFGLPLYYRPRFLVQAVANLASLSDAHCGAAWGSRLPLLLRGLREGSLPNDAGDNRPYGSPDALDLARGLAARLMQHRRANPDVASVTEGDLAVLSALADEDAGQPHSRL